MARTRQKMSEDEKKARRKEQKKLTMRKLREKMKKDPLALKEDRRKARERYYKRKAKGLVKKISEMTRREQKAVRKDWRERALRYRHRLKLAKKTEKIVREETPPSSVRDVPLTNSPSTSRVPTDTSANSPSSSRISSGKKVALRNRKKLRLENEYLRNRLKELEKKMAKYRMRHERRNQKEVKEKQMRVEEVKKDMREEKPENYCKHYEMGTTVVPESILAIARGLTSCSETSQAEEAATVSQLEDLDTALILDSPARSEISQPEDFDTALIDDTTNTSTSPVPSETSQPENPDAALDSDATNASVSPAPSENLQREDRDTSVDDASAAVLPASELLKSADVRRTVRLSSSESLDMWFAGAPYPRKTNPRKTKNFFSDSDSD